MKSRIAYLSLAAWILLTAGTAAASELQNGVPITGLSGAQGEELRYWIDVPDGAQDLRVTNSHGTGDARLYFRHGDPPTLSTHHSASPGAFGPGWEGQAFLPSPLPGTWHFLVYGHTAFSGFGFEVSYVCGPGCGPVVSGCVPAKELTCNSGDVSSNSDPGSTNDIETYTCTPGLTHSGPEMVYSFRAAVDGDVTVKLQGLTADLDLLVLPDSGNECGEGCLTSSTAGGTLDELAVLQAVAETTYYIVVDGYGGAVSDYSIEVICSNNGMIFTDGFETGDLSAWSNH